MQQNMIQEQLLTCLTTELPEEARIGLAQLPAEAWNQIIELSLEQQVFPLFWHRLKTHAIEKLIPLPTRERMQKLGYATTVRNLRLYHELGIILTQLQKHNIPVIVLKGAHLAGAVYSNQALRTMSDVDLMFAQADLPAVVEILSECGYQPATPIVWEAHFTMGHHLPRFAKADSVASIEVHWTITNPGTPYTIPMDELWARAVPVTLAGADALGLCPEDLLLHICMHATYHHVFTQGLRFLCDIDAITRHYATSLDWTQVQQRAHTWGWSRGVYLALYLAHFTLASSIPAPILHKLQLVDSDTAILETSLEQIFDRQTGDDLFSEDFAYLLRAKSWRAKLDILGERMFLSLDKLAEFYPVPLHSRKRYLYFLVRYKDLLSDYGRKIWQLWRRDPVVATSLKRYNDLAQWFEQN